MTKFSEARLRTQHVCDGCGAKKLVRAYAKVSGEVSFLCNDCQLKDFREWILKEKVRFEGESNTTDSQDYDR